LYPNRFPTSPWIVFACMCARSWSPVRVNRPAPIAHSSAPPPSGAGIPVFRRPPDTVFRRRTEGYIDITVRIALWRAEHVYKRPVGILHKQKTPHRAALHRHALVATMATRHPQGAPSHDTTPQHEHSGNDGEEERRPGTAPPLPDGIPNTRTKSQTTQASRWERHEAPPSDETARVRRKPPARVVGRCTRPAHADQDSAGGLGKGNCRRGR